MAQSKLDLEALLRDSDHESARDNVGVFFTLNPKQRALLLRTARASRCSQAGILRIGLELAAAELQAAGKA